MATHRQRRSERSRVKRIGALERTAAQTASGTMAAWNSAEFTAQEQEQFWQRVLAWETAPSTTDFDQLVEAGLDLPAPEALDDEQITRVLWSTIDALAAMSVFISETDHLSDRELYTLLWRDMLREEVPRLPPGPTSASFIQLLSRGSETDTRLYLKYYADEDERRDWLESFPDADMPPHEDPPYDRDRHLPQWTYVRASSRRRRRCSRAIRQPGRTPVPRTLR